MNIRFLNQPKDVKLIDILTSKLENGGFKKVWFVAGFTKDAAFDLIFDSLKIAREKYDTEFECVLGLDKKNTSKDMLLRLMDLGCNIRFHINGDEGKFESRMIIFESDTQNSYVYITGSKFSEGGITDNITLIEEIAYNPEEKKELGKVKMALESGLTEDNFELLSKDRLKELASAGEIVARITERKIPSINELYNGVQNNYEEMVSTYDEGKSSQFKDLLDKDIDINIDSAEKVIVQNSLGEEVEHKLKKEKTTEDKVVTKVIVPEKGADFDTATAFIIPLAKCTNGDIKLPSPIIAQLNVFLNYPDSFHVLEDEKGDLKETKNIQLEIYDNGSNIQLNDDEAKIIMGTKTTSLKSEQLKNIAIDTDDLLRLIKIDNNHYRCEIIKKDTNEYEVWKKFCTLESKGSSKKFGIL